MNGYNSFNTIILNFFDMQPRFLFDIEMKMC